MKKTTLYSMLSLALMLCLLFAGCGASNAGYYSSDELVTEVPELRDSYTYNNNSEKSDSYYLDEADVKERMLVYNIDYTLETKEFDDTCSKIEAKADELGGYVSSYYANTGECDRIEYTFSIPSGKLNDFTSLVESLGTVTCKNTEVQDYTDTYYDYQTEIDLLKTEEEYVQKYLDSATESDERAELIDQLLSIRREIARLEWSSKNIVETVTYSTVNINICEVKVYSDIKVTYGDTLRSAFREGWEGFADFCRELLYDLVRMSPVMVLLIVIFLAVFIPVKVRKNKKKKQMLAIAKAQAEKMSALHQESGATKTLPTEKEPKKE